METVTISQAPVVSYASAAVAPVAWGTVAALLSAVQDLARFFLSLAGSSSLGAGWPCCGRGCSCIWSGGSAVPFGSRWRISRFLCCDCGSCCGGRFSCCCARFVRPSAVSGGLPLQQALTLLVQRWDRSCEEASSGSFPFPGRSSRRREESYRSSSSSSEDDRAESPPPISGREPGGTPGDSRPAQAGDRSPRPRPLGLAAAVFRCSGVVSHRVWRSSVLLSSGRGGR